MNISYPEVSGVVIQSNTSSLISRPGSGLLGSPSRRVYIEQQELLSLEAQAKELRFHWPRQPRLVFQEAQISEPLETTGVLQDAFLESSLTGGPGTYDACPEPQINRELPNGDEQQGTVILTVDQRMNMFFGSGLNMKSVAAAKAAALIAWHTVACGRGLGALLFNDKRILPVRPHCSRRRVLLVLNSLLTQNHALSLRAGLCSNLAILNEALRRTARLATGNCLVILISDGSGQDQETQRLFERIISRNNDLVFARIYDPRQQTRQAASRLDTSSGCECAEDCDGHVFQTSKSSVGRRQQVGIEPPVRTARLIPISNRRNVIKQLRRGLRNVFPQPTQGNGLSEVTFPAIDLRQITSPPDESRI